MAPALRMTRSIKEKLQVFFFPYRRVLVMISGVLMFLIRFSMVSTTKSGRSHIVVVVSRVRNRKARDLTLKNFISIPSRRDYAKSRRDN